jgi:hypothetical protein
LHQRYRQVSDHHVREERKEILSNHALDNRDSQYSDGFIVEDVSKEEREGGAKGENHRKLEMEVKPEPHRPVTAEQKAASKPQRSEDLDEGVPF